MSKNMYAEALSQAMNLAFFERHLLDKLTIAGISQLQQRYIISLKVSIEIGSVVRLFS
jgi:hypothetical protein